jgi:cbb3-type cytochrome oxidase maturation protein
MATRMLIVYLLIGAAFAVGLISWALRSRQFDDQERARFLPLRDLSDAELANPPPRRLTWSVGLVFVVAAVGLLAVAQLVIRLVALTGTR